MSAMISALLPSELVQTRRCGRCFFRTVAVFRTLHAVLLDQHPRVAAVAQCLDELEGDVRVVRQRHLGRRKSPHPLQRLDSEETAKWCCQALTCSR